MTLSPPHARPIHPWHLPQLLVHGWACIPKGPNRWKEVHSFNSWDRGFALSFIRHEEKACHPGARTDPLANTKGACPWPQNWKIRKEDSDNRMGGTLPGPQLHSAQSSLYLWTSPMSKYISTCSSPCGLTFLLFAAESILIKTAALWGRNLISCF